VKKAARRIKQPVAELIEQPAPSVITAMEDEETPE
jgi:hypothetical protein